MVRRRDLMATLGSGADLAVRQGVQFLALIVLARILRPEEFGTVALLAIFVSFGAVLADLGLTTALLQARALSQADISTAFWASVASGSALSLVGIASAWPIARALNVPQWGPVSAVMASGIVLTALGSVPTAMLIRRLAFGRLLVVGSVATVSSGTIAIAMALAGKGVWALAAQTVIMSAVTAGGAWVASGVQPTLTWDRDSARRLLGMGRWVLAANLCDVLYGRAQTLLVGGLFGPAPLGYYMRADSTQQFPADAVSAIVGRVALPVFSESSENRPALVNGLRTSLRSTMAINAPAIALLGALAGPLVHVLYGPGWDRAVPLLTLLSLAGLAWPLHVMNINVLYAVGAAETVFRIDLIKKAAAVLLTVGGAMFGLTGVACAQVLVGWFAVGVNGHATGRLVGLGARQQVRLVAPEVSVALGTGLVVWLIERVWSGQSLLELVVLGGLGAAMYVVTARMVGATAVADTLRLLHTARRRA